MKVVVTIIIVILNLGLFAQNEINWSETDTIFDDSGRVIYIIELDDEFEAISYEYTEDGILLEEVFETWKNDIQYEIVTEYHANGNKKTISCWYILDKFFYGKPSLDSVYSEYNEQGELVETTEFLNNKLNGSNCTYYKSGSLKGLITYRNNKRHGPKITYFRNGEIESESEYVDGRMISATYYDEEGNAFENTEFLNGEGKLYFYELGELKGYCHFRKGKARKCNCDCN